jgi:hypothetical protein
MYEMMLCMFQMFGTYLHVAVCVQPKKKGMIMLLMKLCDEMYLVDKTLKFWTCVVKLLWLADLWFFWNASKRCGCLVSLWVFNGFMKRLIFLLHILKGNKNFFHGHNYFFSWNGYGQKKMYIKNLTRGGWSTISTTLSKGG